MKETRDSTNFGSRENMVQCHYRGAIIDVPARIFFSVLTMTQCDDKKFVRYKEGAKMYAMSEREFNRLAHDAGAVYKRNTMALVSIAKVDEYLEYFREVIG